MSVGEIATITAPTLVRVGDDHLARLAHTCELYETLPPGNTCLDEYVDADMGGRRRRPARRSGV